MVEKIISVLKNYKDIDYKLTEVKKERLENYFVKKQREIDRLVKTTHYYLTVYTTFEEDGEKYRGSAAIEIYPSTGGLESPIDEAIFAAGYVKNKYYPLVNCNLAPHGGVDTDLGGMGQADAMKSLQAALYSQDNKQNGFINYSEFFVSKLNYRVINSKGLDISFTKHKAFIESAATWKENNKEVEFYESYNLNECNTGLISQRVGKLFEYAAQKTAAINMPKISGIDVVLSGECIKRFFEYFYTNSNASSVYNGQSVFKVGGDVQGSSYNDKISMSLAPFLKGSTESAQYDSDGFALDNQEVIKEGVLLKYWGDIRYSYYLGIAPTGSIGNYIISGGTYSNGDLRSGEFLEIVSFSDFHMNSVTGDFGAEARLGFYCKGGEKTAVTGGSISGNIKNVLGEIKMSKGQMQFNNFVGPEAIRVKNINIAGI
ncbi:MAG: TldD/PmbA family protein, partial [Clostridiales bacterium]|nr:TldD/PmbA family protein [Clostridiales bacterium]